MRVLLVCVILVSAALVAASATAGQGATEEQAFLLLINNYRQAKDLEPLSLSRELNAAADWMANDMAARHYFDHVDSLGRDPFQRMTDFGYNHAPGGGENLVGGLETAQGAFNVWKNLPGHNANMLNPNFKVIGIAHAYGGTGSMGWYWVTDFGPAAPQPPPLATPTVVPQPAELPQTGGYKETK